MNVPIILLYLSNSFRENKNKTMTSIVTDLNSLEPHLNRQPYHVRLLNQTPERLVAKNDSKRSCTVLSLLQEGQEGEDHVKTFRKKIFKVNNELGPKCNS